MNDQEAGNPEEEPDDEEIIAMNEAAELVGDTRVERREESF